MTRQELKQKKISAISLGCDKNRVDLEKMLFLLSDYGFQIVENVYEADIVLVNTCAFILPAKREAIENIIEMESLKKSGKIEKLFVTGCLVERNLKEIKAEFNLVDGFVNIKDNSKIVSIIEKSYGLPITKSSDQNGRILTTSCGYAYLKIADGCNNVCSYCTIPRIRGRYHSYEIDELVSEAKLLVKKGVKEIILVAQDTTRYGQDLYGKPMLVDLCKKIAKIKEVEKIRIHYAYPEMVTRELLDYIKNEPKMCKYLDIPLQHIDDEILKSMRRKLDENSTRELMQMIRRDYPEIALRSTFIVGYPGESRKAFKKLIDFLKEVKIDYAGFFPYYREENTLSYFMKKQKPNFVKLRRLKVAKKVQNDVSTQLAKANINRKMSVLVDYYDENAGVYISHSEFLSPTVDFDIKIVDNGNIEIGKFYNVRLVDFDGEGYKGEIDELTK